MNSLYKNFLNSYPQLTGFNSQKSEPKTVKLELSTPQTPTNNTVGKVKKRVLDTSSENSENPSPLKTRDRLIARTTNLTKPSSKSNICPKLLKYTILAYASMLVVLHSGDFALSKWNDYQNSFKDKVPSPPKEKDIPDVNPPKTSVDTTSTTVNSVWLNHSYCYDSCPWVNTTQPSANNFESPATNFSAMQLVPQGFDFQKTSENVYPFTANIQECPAKDISGMQLVPQNYFETQKEFKPAYPLTQSATERTCPINERCDLTDLNLTQTSTSSAIKLRTTGKPKGSFQFRRSNNFLSKTYDQYWPGRASFLKKLDKGVGKFHNIISNQISSGSFDLTKPQLRKAFGFTHRSLSASQQREFYEYANAALKKVKNEAMVDANEDRKKFIAEKVSAIRKVIKSYTRSIGPNWSKYIAEKIDLSRSGNKDGYDYLYYAEKYKYNWTTVAEKSCGPNPDINLGTQIVDWIPTEDAKTLVSEVYLEGPVKVGNDICDQWNRQELSESAKAGISQISKTYSKITSLLTDNILVKSLDGKAEPEVYLPIRKSTITTAYYMPYYSYINE